MNAIGLEYLDSIDDVPHIQQSTQNPAGFDLYSADSCYIFSYATQRIRTGVRIREAPHNAIFCLTERREFNGDIGLHVLSPFNVSIGEEIHVTILNFLHTDRYVRRRDKIAILMCLRVEIPPLIHQPNVVNRAVSTLPFIGVINQSRSRDARENIPPEPERYPFNPNTNNRLRQ